MSEAKGKRSSALDAFRGITIVGMLVVNNAALGEYTPATLLHADWSGGVTLADLVFPWFLLAMGVACGLSSKPAPAGRVASRVLWLLFLGMVIDSAVQSQLSIGLGVLQLIGLAYGVAALAMRLPPLWRGVLGALLVACHAALLLWGPNPGADPGTITEAHNAVFTLNDWLEPLHLRGLLSVLTTGGLAIMGSFAGTAMRSGVAGWRVVGLIGVGAAALGALLGTVMPMFKPIWTASYVLYVGGLGLIALSLLLALELKVRLDRWLFPFVAFGMNALVAYVGPILVKVMVLQVWTLGDGPYAGQTLSDAGMEALTQRWGEPTGPILYLSIYICAWLALCAVLYKKRVFVRV
ncbi:MAG: heparan-alpha-glucosaminide N-acetyltransferase domain-containing protein [Fimbriimonadales bacterium]